MWPRAARDFLIYGFAAFGICWTLVESFSALFPKNKPEGLIPYLAIIVVSILVGIWRAYPKQSVKINVPNSDSYIEIKFGDLFSHTTGIAIPVNEYFDSELGDHVSERSLHGQFIKNILGGQSSSFDELTTAQLSDISTECVERSCGRKNKYPIGTTVRVLVNDKNYFLFALSRTDISTLKASATVRELWDALAGLWRSVRNYSNGEEIGVPLAGSGLAGVGLPTKNLIDFILTSLFFYTKKQKIANSVALVLPHSLRYDIDLQTIKRYWSS